MKGWMEPSEARSKERRAGEWPSERRSPSAQEGCAGAAGWQSPRRQAEVGAARQLLVLGFPFNRECHGRYSRSEATLRRERRRSLQLSCQSRGRKVFSFGRFLWRPASGWARLWRSAAALRKRKAGTARVFFGSSL